jgi:hypothetical protein
VDLCDCIDQADGVLMVEQMRASPALERFKEVSCVVFEG